MRDSHYAPRSPAVVVHQHKSAHPFNALPRIQVRHHQTQRPAMLRRQRRAIVLGDQNSQIFEVTYADGTSSFFTQSVSDWYTPENFPGESQAVLLPYRLDGEGDRDNREFHVYGYSFPLDDRKTVRTLTLPQNPQVLVLAATWFADCRAMAVACVKASVGAPRRRLPLGLRLLLQFFAVSQIPKHNAIFFSLASGRA